MFKITNADFFRRWERDKTIKVSDSSIDKVYFTTDALDKAVEVEVNNGVAEVPNFLMRQSYDITVYGYVGGNVKMKTFAIKDGEKPITYEVWKEWEDGKKPFKFVEIDEFVEETKSIPCVANDNGGGSSSSGSNVAVAKMTELNNGEIVNNSTKEEWAAFIEKEEGYIEYTYPSGDTKRLHYQGCAYLDGYEADAFTFLRYKDYDFPSNEIYSRYLVIKYNWQSENGFEGYTEYERTIKMIDPNV